jgi:hypothetical protein
MLIGVMLVGTTILIYALIVKELATKLLIFFHL